ncbi:MAG: hypothetical protein IJH39_01100 [Clostridia bacterium]|nr:hypothetical protein [Clostridia bacterium]
MSKYSFGNDQYVVYARNEQEARQIISQELKRFDSIKRLMSNLLKDNGQAMQNFIDNTSEDRLNIHFNDELSGIYDIDPTAKGEVRQRNMQDDIFYYDLAYRYPEIEGHNANFRLAHEMGHLMLNPSNAQRQTLDKQSNSRQVAGLIRRDEVDNHFYGEEIQENAINLLAQLAIRGDAKADDIITGKVDVSEFNSYKKCDDLVKLLAVSMRNDFDKEMSFEQLTQNKIDSLITHYDGTQEPANTFFYGILNDSSMVENEFDKYLGNGAWRELNEAFSELYKTNISKERFELIFQNAQGLIQEFANARFQDKYKEAVVRNGGFNVPTIENKLKMINVMTGQRVQTIESQEQQMEMPEGYSINEFGEIIRPARTEQLQSNMQQQNQNKLSLKQRVAQFLQRNNLFMNLSFVENFVHQQLDVLPSPAQETRASTANRSRTEFENWITNNGQLRNLPPIQRMSDPQKLEEMRRKMEQGRQSDDEINR